MSKKDKNVTDSAERKKSMGVYTDEELINFLNGSVAEVDRSNKLKPAQGTTTNIVESSPTPHYASPPRDPKPQQDKREDIVAVTASKASSKEDQANKRLKSRINNIASLVQAQKSLIENLNNPQTSGGLVAASNFMAIDGYLSDKVFVNDAMSREEGRAILSEATKNHQFLIDHYSSKNDRDEKGNLVHSIHVAQESKRKLNSYNWLQDNRLCVPSQPSKSPVPPKELIREIKLKKTSQEVKVEKKVNGVKIRAIVNKVLHRTPKITTEKKAGQLNSSKITEDGASTGNYSSEIRNKKRDGMRIDSKNSTKGKRPTAIRI